MNMQELPLDFTLESSELTDAEKKKVTVYDVLDYLLDDLVSLVTLGKITKEEYLELDISIGRVMRAIMNTKIAVGSQVKLNAEDQENYLTELADKILRRQA